MSHENEVKVLAQASAFLRGLAALDGLQLDKDIRSDAIRELVDTYLMRGAKDLFPGIDELIIEDITVRTPQYNENPIHHSHTLKQIESWVESKRLHR
jgi:hypothetical protein